MIRWEQFADVCTQELELCGVREGQSVVVLSQARDDLDKADAFLAAARRLGARAYNLRLGDTATTLTGGSVWAVGVNPLRGNESAITALKEADLVIDLVFLLWSQEQLDIQAGGTRMLLAIEPPDAMARMFPTLDHRRRVEASEEMILKASSMRVTSRAGTDVVYKLGTCPVIGEYGYTATPGRWDCFPSGFVFTGGTDDGVDGRVVVDVGDVVVAPWNAFVRTPIEFTIEAGRIADIRGGLDADLLKDYIAEFDDDRAYAVSHIGWGINEKARWARLTHPNSGFGSEARSLYGNVMFATGPNKELGGTNDTPAHIDIPMRNCSVYLDDAPIVIDGDFVVDELKVPGAVAAATT
jgi:2,5-dihydroxypyridine 5,6-dioxygenase